MSSEFRPFYEEDPIEYKGTRPPKKNNKKRNRRRRRGPGEDRYFGRFKCKICHKMWESAHVYTVGGTMKVKYKQRCKNCKGDDAWVFPYDLEMIMCSMCQNPSIECKCLCEDCDKLWYRPRGKGFVLNEEDYCRCDRRNSKKNGLGEKIDPKKRHEKELCQRCSTGRLCWGRSRWQEEGYDYSNEP